MRGWRVRAEIGGIRFILQGTPPVRAQSRAYRAFVEAGEAGKARVETGPSVSEIPIDVVAGPIEPRWLADWSPGRMRLDTESTWALRLTGDPRWPYHLGPSPIQTSDPPLFHLLAGPRFEQARLYLGGGILGEGIPDGPEGGMEGGIDDRHFYPLDEVFFHHVAAFQGALVVHASGVELSGGGALFLGDSGAGKSTIAGLLEQAGAARRIFSDDRIVIRRDAGSGRWWMHGTPWHGTLARTAAGGVELQALCFIEKAPGIELEALTPARALPRLLQVALLPWWLPEAPALQLGVLDGLLAAASPRFYRLGFPPEVSVIAELPARLFGGIPAAVES